jgi:O-antigen/teichoic acid export membrane protein
LSPRRLSRRLSSGALVTLAAAAAVFWIAFEQATFGLQSRGLLAIAVWWAILVLLAFGICPVARIPRAGLVAGGLLLALAAWTLASLAWTESAEKTFNEFNRVSLYVGVYWLVAISAAPRVVGRLCDGLAVGLTGIGLLALAGRLFPTAFPAGSTTPPPSTLPR